MTCHSLIITPCPLFGTKGGKEGDSPPHKKRDQGSRNPSRNQTADLLLRGSSANLCTTVLAQGGTGNNGVRWVVRGAATLDPNRWPAVASVPRRLARCAVTRRPAIICCHHAQFAFREAYVILLKLKPQETKESYRFCSDICTAWVHHLSLFKLSFPCLAFGRILKHRHLLIYKSLSFTSCFQE